MFPKSILVVVLVLALVTMACGIQVDLPEINIPVETNQSRPYPNRNDQHPCACRGEG